MKSLLHLGNGIGLTGILLAHPTLQAAGVFLFCHRVLDRIMEHGLKYEKGFIFTHLATIGPKREPNA